jgi:hypothetical protein
VAKAMNNIYKNEGMAIFIKGKMVIGIHPDNLINNLYNLSEGNMKVDWGGIAENAGIGLSKLPKNVMSDSKINLTKMGSDL